MSKYKLDLMSWRGIDHIAEMEKIDSEDLLDLIDSQRGTKTLELALHCFIVAYARAGKTTPFENRQKSQLSLVPETAALKTKKG